MQVSALTGEGLDELRARIAERFADRFEEVRLFLPHTEGGRLAELYALGAPIDERVDTEDGVYIKATAAAPRAAPLRALTSSRRRYAKRTRPVIELPVQRLRDDAVLPAPAYAGDAGLDLSACERVELGPGERATVGTGLAVAIPEGYAGFVQPRSGLAARHGITIVNAPGLVDSGYRGELRVVLLNTDRAAPFVVEPGMRIAQLVVMPVAARRAASRWTSCPQSERGVRGFGSSSG